MKKKIFVLGIIVLLISFLVKILARKNRNINPIGIRFVRQDGSHVNMRTVFPKKCEIQFLFFYIVFTENRDF